MKKFTICLILGLMSQMAFAQEKAITESGDTLIIYSDGTWDYYENFVNPGSRALPKDNVPITENPTPFTKPSGNTTKLEGGNGMYALYYNPTKWKRTPPGRLNAEAEYALQTSTNDAFCLIIYERIEIPQETLLDVAVTNAKSAATNAKMVKKEYRTVNGTRLINGTMEASINDIGFVYYSYYYSDERGTIQLITFTGDSLFEEIRPDLEELLNGFVVLSE